ncbi:MAG TPA: NAD(P)/FAD-dependent oxidoreductase [Acidobacteriaceae bacterium]|nr:NAD(P)/FAD-dependent oxidoreductase [Acidobacteriaceae bacterium]
MKRAVIIGAGPAGLTAALEFLRGTDIQPIVLEASHEIGGISRTIRYKGNRMDIGGHRFFSKSDRVMQWWLALMPPEATDENAIDISYQGRQRPLEIPRGGAHEPPLRGMGPLRGGGGGGGHTVRRESGGGTATAVAPAEPEVSETSEAPASEDLVMLVRPRKSRIYYLRKFFDYPINLSGNTITNLGPVRMAKIGVSYVTARLKPIKKEKSLEDFLINRFGRELYLTFFKSYTEKVWGTPCDRISAEWGAQRIKGLSLTTALKHFARKAFSGKPKGGETDVAQKGTDTSLIERFLYPKFGPGQLWEHVAEKVVAGGGEIHMGRKVDRIVVSGDRVMAVETVDDDGNRELVEGDHFISTMPIKELVRALAAGGAKVPGEIREISEGLEYRDFITVGLLANKLDVKEPDGGLVKDTWIYIQEPDVLIGRLQIFNNWSPYMLADPTKVWIGLEYFCYETDPLWSMPDEDMKRFAAKELETIGILQTSEVLDAHVVRVPKTYPAYFGTYERFDELRAWVDGVENLYLVGRNGMHKYNNQDHSMLTAMAVVDGLAAGHVDKHAVWSINTEQEYHEEKEK